MSQPASAPVPRVPIYRGVQALRLVSALTVVALHACYWLNRDASSTGRAPSSETLGTLCVAVFFLISGFIVVRVVDSGQEPDWRTFALGRAIRILPLAWAMTTIKIVAAITVPSALFDGGLAPARILSSYLFLPSRDPDGTIRMLWGVEWTLVFEIAFYVLVCVAIACRIDPLLIATPVLILTAVLSVWQSATGSVLWFYADPIVLFLLVGMAIGRAASARRPLEAVIIPSAAAAVFAFVTAARGEMSLTIAALVFVTLTAAFALLVTAEGRLGRMVPNWVVHGGDAAFALYLTHPLIAQALPRLLGTTRWLVIPWWLVVLVSVIASFGLSIVVHRWLDAPVGRALRRVLLPHRGSGSVLQTRRTRPRVIRKPDEPAPRDASRDR